MSDVIVGIGTTIVALVLVIVLGLQIQVRAMSRQLSDILEKLPK